MYGKDDYRFALALMRDFDTPEAARAFVLEYEGRHPAATPFMERVHAAMMDIERGVGSQCTSHSAANCATRSARSVLAERKTACAK